jgi:hypothetical protein
MHEIAELILSGMMLAWIIYHEFWVHRKKSPLNKRFTIL